MTYVAFHPSDGAFAKWYDPSGTYSPDFIYEAVQYIGGTPNTWQNAQLIPTSWGVIAFRPSDGAFAKWYNLGDRDSPSPDFIYEAVQYIGGTPNTWQNAQLIPTSWGVIAFRPSDGAFAKWYEAESPSPDFRYQAVRFIGGAPNTW